MKCAYYKEPVYLCLFKVKEMEYQISLVNQEALKWMRELLVLKSYSKNTMKTYCNEFSQFLSTLNNTLGFSCAGVAADVLFVLHTNAETFGKHYPQQVKRCKILL
jgi:hypothetical protein